MNAEMGDTKDAIIAMRDNTFAIDSPSDDNGNDRRTSLDEATVSHQVITRGGTPRFSSSKYLLSSS